MEQPIENQTSQNRKVYFIIYDSMYNNEKLYVSRSKGNKHGVTDINLACRYSTLKSALHDIQHIKKGNPRIECHKLNVDPEVLLTYDVIDGQAIKREGND